MNSTTFQILAVLRSGPRDAGQILDALREVIGAREAPALASFYRSVKRALDDRHIRIVGSAAPTEGPGRRSQIYEVTERGVEVAKAEALRLRSLAAMALRDEAVR